MTRFKPIYCLFIFWLSLCSGYSQFFTAGEEPFFTKWHHFNTAHYHIIYPYEIEDKAFHIGHLLESTIDTVYNTMPSDKRKKIPVVLHNRMADANGFVTWAPRRMEWYTIPPPTVYNEPWLLQLAVHEQRHIAQLHKFRNKVLYPLLGEQATGAYVGFTPLWFIEGDAVIQETVLGKAGRGRTPAFNRHYRALARENIRYSYDKAALGSYKDYIPNHYQLGYQLSSYARVHAGEMIWTNTLNGLRKNPFRIKAFSKSLEKHSGLSTDKLYKQTFDSINQFWVNDLNSRKTKNYEILIKEVDDYIHYQYPVAVSDTGFFAVRQSLSSRSTLISIKGNEIQKIKELGTRYNEPLSGNENYLVWSELISNPRWKNISYSVIKRFDLQTSRVNQLTKRSKLFSPDIHPSNNRIVAIEYNRSNNVFLAFLDAGNGNKYDKIAYPFSHELLKPQWKNDSVVVALANTPEGKRFIQYNLHPGTWEYLSDAFPFDIANFTLWKQYILFQGSFQRADQIYAYDPAANTVFQVTFAEIAAENPKVHNNRLYFNEYDANGFMVSRMQLDKADWNRLDVKAAAPGKIWIEALTSQEQALDIESIYDNHHTDYESKKYNKLIHSFNIHSWYPFFTSADFSSVQMPQVYPGITLLSQNVLSTFITTLSTGYDGERWLLRPTVTYRGLLPVIQFDYSNYYNRRFFNLGSDANVRPDLSEVSHRWTVRSYIPLSYTTGAWRYSFTPGYRMIFENDVFVDDEVVAQGALKSHAFGTLSWEKRMAQRDLYPRFGQRLSVNYYPQPFTNDYFPPLYNIVLSNYLPGAAKHHSLRITMAYEEQDYRSNRNIRYLYPQNLVPARGQSARNSIETYLLKTDYSMPLFYPDWRLGYVLYMKRVGTNVFYDYARQKVLRQDSNNTPPYEDRVVSESAGVDLFTDLHLLRFLFPVRLGGRFIYDLHTTHYQVQWLFNLNIPY